MAISSADICSSGTPPPVYAAMSQRMSSSESRPPSRLALISPATPGPRRPGGAGRPAGPPEAGGSGTVSPPSGQVGGAERGGQQRAKRPRTPPPVEPQTLAAGFEQQLAAAAAGPPGRAVRPAPPA